MSNSPKYQDRINKAKSLKNVAIVLLSTSPILFIVIIFVFPIVVALNRNTTTILSFVVAWLVLTICYLLFTFITSIIAIIKIGVTDWLDDSLNNDKTLYWALSLVFMFIIGFVGPVLWIVWYSKVNNKLSILDNEEKSKQETLKLETTNQ